MKAKNYVWEIIINIITLGIFSDIVVLIEPYKTMVMTTMDWLSTYLYIRSGWNIKPKVLFAIMLILNVITLGGLTNFGMIMLIKEMKAKKVES